MTLPPFNLTDLIAKADARRKAIAGIVVKPCPFCGRNDGQLTKTLDLWYVLCEYDCNACGPAATSPEKAAELWNARKG